MLFVLCRGPLVCQSPSFPLSRVRRNARKAPTQPLPTKRGRVDAEQPGDRQRELGGTAAYSNTREPLIPPSPVSRSASTSSPCCFPCDPSSLVRRHESPFKTRVSTGLQVDGRVRKSGNGGTTHIRPRDETAPSEIHQRFTVFKASHLQPHLGSWRFEDGDRFVTTQSLPFFAWAELRGT